MAEFRIDDRDLVRTVQALRRTDPEIVKALRKGMREAGNTVRDDVRAAAGRTGSRRIPRAVKVVTKITARTVTVTVRVDPKIAPQAKVFEGRRGGGSLSHPVHARGPRSGWTWVKQKPRPYFHGTAQGDAPQVQRLVFALVTDAVQQTVKGSR